VKIPLWHSLTIINKNQLDDFGCSEDFLAMSNANKKLPNIFDLTFVDIVGLDSESHVQSCTQYLYCGHSVKKNNVIFCTWQIQLIENSTLG
jgi:hypothetical protein